MPNLQFQTPEKKKKETSETPKMRALSIPLLFNLLLLVPLPSSIHGWGIDGHQIICKIAQDRLSKRAAMAVDELLPEYARSNLSSLCSWADNVRFRYHWSAPLHFADTPDDLCSYSFTRDCKDGGGERGACVSGAIKNYTNQLLEYGSNNSGRYNLTEALLFLSHFMGDVHQPLHVGFTSDKGGNTIDIHWYTRKQVLHHVWDVSIIETAEERFYNSDAGAFFEDIKRNITEEWADRVERWEHCGANVMACPDVYARESIKAACAWAYKDAQEGSVLEDEYFLSRLGVVILRLAQGGVRLAATLNHVFK